MRKIKQIANQLAHLVENESQELSPSLFEYLFYSPKFPLRKYQLELLDRARKEEVSVFDEYFEKEKLKINVFIWGHGKEIVLLTHGWASKAADFSHMVERLIKNPAYTIIAFDAPGNGSSEGGLTNLLLYVRTIYKVVEKFGDPFIMIGHSLGAMANIIAYKNLKVKPKLLVSLAPLVQLGDYFRTEMNHAHIPSIAIDKFFVDFVKSFNMEVSQFDLNKLYDYTCDHHWLYYDEHDIVSPNILTRDFLKKKTDIQAKLFKDVGHHQMIRNDQVISTLVNLMEQFSL